MEDIARMADDCMRDVDEDEDDDNLEDDEDLLVGVSCTVHLYLKVCACVSVYFSNVALYMSNQSLLVDELLFFFFLPSGRATGSGG